MDLILGEWDAVALKNIRYHWGSAYEISGGGDLWHARPRSAPRDFLTARTSGELRELIRADYFSRTSTRKVITDPAGRHY